MSQFLNKQYYSLPPLEDNHDQPKLIPFFPSYETSSSQYDHIPYQTTETITYSDEDHDDHQDDDHHHYYPSEESNESIVLRITTPVTKNEKDDQNTNMCSGSTNSCLGTAKWMSSKMRLMRKMMNSYPHQKILQPTGKSSTSSSISISNSTNSSNGCVRTCSDCNTTKTPLWRSGPQGPKSLCNACGIRQRKARKAMAAAAEKASNDGTCNAVIPYKKRYKLEQTRRKIQAEDFSSISLKKKKTSFHPQDEKEAAILLMALSCDLIYG